MRRLRRPPMGLPMSRKASLMRMAFCRRFSSGKELSAEESHTAAVLQQLSRAIEKNDSLAERLAPGLSPSTRNELAARLVEEHVGVFLEKRGHTTSKDSVAVPSSLALWRLALHRALPFVGFGFMDNFVMILGGDFIDVTAGVYFQLSTLAAVHKHRVCTSRPYCHGALTNGVPTPG